MFVLVGAGLLFLHVVEDKVNELKVRLVDFAEVLLDIDIRNLVHRQLMVQHVVYGHLVNVGLVESDCCHRMASCIERETFLVNHIPNLF